MAHDRLKVMIGCVMAPAEVQYLIDSELRLDITYEPELYAPQQFPSDFVGQPGWRRTPEAQAHFIELCESAQVLLGIPDSSPKLLRRIVAGNPNLIWLHSWNAGGGGNVRAAQLSDADLKRVIFTTSAGIHAGPLAEFALFGALCGIKGLAKLQDLKAKREWAQRWPIQQLSKATVVVAGMGGIGRMVAAKFTALGATVIGVNRSLKDVPGVEVHLDADLATVAAQADVLVNCLPEAVGTEQLISAEVLAALKPGATVVSVGRGTCIDEEALIAGLTSGQIGFAALDVVAHEPLPQDSPLWTLPNVLTSPHTMALDVDEPTHIIDLFVANARALLAGEELRNVMNTELFY